MTKLLISAVACGHGQGSEAGVGWQTAAALSQFFDVTVLTSTCFKKANDAAVNAGQAPFRIEYHATPETAHSLGSRACFLWHSHALEAARRLARELRIDAALHSTFIQYRTPFLASQLGVPFVLGPIGGAETIPLNLFGDLPFALQKKELFRHLPFDALIAGYYRGPRDLTRQIFCSCDATARRLRSVWPQEKLRLLPAIAIRDEEILPPTSDREEPHVIYAGRMLPEKGLAVFLEALALCQKQGQPGRAKLIGVRHEQDRLYLERLLNRYGLARENIELHAFLPREQLRAWIVKAAAFIYPAFRDSGSMALLEALAGGAWPICFDIPSQFWLPQDLATKIPLVNRARAVGGLARAISESLSADRRTPQWQLRRVEYLRSALTWSAKARAIRDAFAQPSS